MNFESNESVARLFEAIALLKDSKECAEFLKDLCTVGEIEGMAQRFEAAGMLYSGDNYVNVSAKTGISTATISRVSKCLKKKGGYVKILERMNGEKIPEN